MDVKDITNNKPLPEKISAPSAQRALNFIPSVRPSAAEVEPVTVSVAKTVSPGSDSEHWGKLNQVINVINVVSEATSSITKLVDSMSGIVEQAGKDNADPHRQKVLAEEANQLAEAIRSTAAKVPTEGMPSLADDKIRIEVEQKLSRALEAIFSSDAEGQAGLGTIGFSSKQAIIDTGVKVAVLKQRIQELQVVVDEGSETLKRTVSSFEEVARENNEAAQVSIRDVNKASKLAEQTSLVIGKDPDGAWRSVGNITRTAIQLLES